MTQERSSLDALIASLAVTWPQHNFGPRTVMAYTWGLEDLPLAEAAAAIETLVRTSEFPPTIAAIRTAVAEARLALPSAEEAYEMVNRAVAEQTTRELPAPVKRALDALGGSWAWRTTDNVGVLRAHFTRFYVEFRAVALREVQLGELAPPARRRELGPGS